METDDFDAQMADIREKALAIARRVIVDLRDPAWSPFGSDLFQEAILATPNLREMLREVGEERMIGYLVRVIRRRLVNLVRDQGRQKRHPGPGQLLDWSGVEDRVLDPRSSPPEAAEAAEQAALIADMINALPPRQCEAVRLYFWGRLTLAEVAVRMGCTTSSVAQLLARAQHRLGKSLWILHRPGEPDPDNREASQTFRY